MYFSAVGFSLNSLSGGSKVLSSETWNWGYCTHSLQGLFSKIRTTTVSSIILLFDMEPNNHTQYLIELYLSNRKLRDQCYVWKLSSSNVGTHFYWCLLRARTLNQTRCWCLLRARTLNQTRCWCLLRARTLNQTRCWCLLRARTLNTLLVFIEGSHSEHVVGVY